ncbi:MAG: triose-phosphate isomerase, partial [Planctomycetes bacterium]|nr:triose-phosphate isomerase [Planctomycetota bacterium]
MNLTREESLALAGQCMKLAEEIRSVSVRVFPGYLVAAEAASLASGSSLEVGAQNCHNESSGAYTGEVSPAQLIDAGVRHILIGHSERRQHFGEGDTLIAAK